MVKGGLKISVNSDDPTVFGTNIAKEYEIAADEIGLSVEQIISSNLDAVDASFCTDEKLKAELKGRITQFQI